jgi:microcystin-dependent protein
MVTVTGFTADRMLEIENTCIVDGDVVDGDLILKQRDDTEINAGSVIGPTGPEGPPGGLITGEIRMTILTSAPTDWFLLNGQTITGAETLYPDFWAVAPASWKSGSNIILPNATRRHLIGGDTPGVVGGSDFIVLATANLPPHTHSDGTLTAASAGNHFHNTHADQAKEFSGAINGIVGSPLEKVTFGPLATTTAGAHTHDITGATGSTPSSQTPYEHRPQYLIVNVMIYMGPSV